MEHAGLAMSTRSRNWRAALAWRFRTNRPAAGDAQREFAQKVALDLYEVMQTATRYYREQLKSSQRAIDYLKQRGLSGEIAARFGIGYAPDAWQNLAAAFPDYQAEILSETGLVVSSDEGKRYDRFP